MQTLLTIQQMLSTGTEPNINNPLQMYKRQTFTDLTPLRNSGRCIKEKMLPLQTTLQSFKKGLLTGGVLIKTMTEQPQTLL